MKRAIVLLSGGLDSTTALAIARSEGYECHALSFRYGQRHVAELEAAEAVAKAQEVASHRVLTLDLAAFGGSALTTTAPVPKDRSPSEMSQDTPVTYVPARNTIFLSYALALGEVMDVRDVFIGVNALDYSGYPDCRPEYIAAYERVANLGTRSTAGREWRIHAPLVHWAKAEIIRCGMAQGVDYALTHSCYDPVRTSIGGLAWLACGRCDACVLRLQGFAAAGVPDPIRYVPAPSER